MSEAKKKKKKYVQASVKMPKTNISVSKNRKSEPDDPIPERTSEISTASPACLRTECPDQPTCPAHQSVESEIHN